MKQHDRGNPSNKVRTRELQDEMRRILMDWDPIGVKGEPGAADEYDCLIGPLMRRLAEGRAVADIHSWLAHELTNHFGLTSTPDRDLAVVKKLVAWWRTSTTDGG